MDYILNDDDVPLIRNYKLIDKNIVIKTEDGLTKKYQYSLDFEQEILKIMEEQSFKYCDVEITEERSVIMRQILNMVLESFCILGLGANSIRSNDTNLFNFVLFLSTLTAANGCFVLYRNKELKRLKKIKFYLNNKEILNLKGLNINEVTDLSMNKLKKLTLTK